MPAALSRISPAQATRSRDTLLEGAIALARDTLAPGGGMLRLGPGPDVVITTVGEIPNHSIISAAKSLNH